MGRAARLAAATALGIGFVGTSVTTGASAQEEGTSSTSQVQRGGPAERALEALAQRPGIARAAVGQAFDVTSVTLDGDGTSHVRIDRTYRGLPVLGGDLVVHQAPDGTWEGADQTLAAPLDLPVTAELPAAAAVRAALARSAATRTIAGMREAGAPALVVDTLTGRSRLAWEVVTGGTQADGTPSRLASYVDAVTGEVLRREEQIQTADGQGRTLYSGSVPLQVTARSGGYELRDATRGGTYTTDMAGKSDGVVCQLFGSCSNGTIVTAPTTTFGNGTGSDPDTAAADAQYGTNVTWDYYRTIHGRNGIFGTGAGSLNRVHYGKGYVNAFWDGQKMTYGDGDGTSYGPLVSLDVAGHEMSHGVTENTSNLTYSGESGGLNEATSDIFGTMVEFYAANASDPGDYLIGEEFDLASGVGFRRMDDPDSDGASQNCWTTGTKNLDVHYSSGVGNHFFYLLAEGSGTKTIGGVQHSSTTCDGSTITGIGRDAAQRIWYRALTTYFTSGTTYAQARTATIRGAGDLFGAGSTQAATVAAAWSAVSVS
jgi:Zn-dependent metalloprotease